LPAQRLPQPLSVAQRCHKGTGASQASMRLAGNEPGISPLQLRAPRRRTPPSTRTERSALLPRHPEENERESATPMTKNMHELARPRHALFRTADVIKDRNRKGESTREHALQEPSQPHAKASARIAFSQTKPRVLHPKTPEDPIWEVSRRSQPIDAIQATARGEHRLKVRLRQLDPIRLTTSPHEAQEEGLRPL